MKKLALFALAIMFLFPLHAEASSSDADPMNADAAQVDPKSDGSANATINLNKDSSLFDEGIADPDPPLPHDTTILDGIPLMEGLQISKDTNLITVLPDDSKHPLIAVGVLDVDDIYNFYKTELPSRGWKASGARDYMRDQTLLHINAQADGKLSTVTFTETTAK